jgi:hypothetical protein
MTRYLELIHYRALSELKMELSRLYLGILWWVFEPILYMVVFYLVFDLPGQGWPELMICPRIDPECLHRFSQNPLPALC